MPRSPFVATSVVGYACSICIYCPGYFLAIERLFQPSSGGTCKPSPLLAGKNRTRDQAFQNGLRRVQQKRLRPSSVQSASGDFSQAYSGCQKSFQIQPVELVAYFLHWKKCSGLPTPGSTQNGVTRASFSKSDADLLTYDLSAKNVETLPG